MSLKVDYRDNYELKSDEDLAQLRTLFKNGAIVHVSFIALYTIALFIAMTVLLISVEPSHLPRALRWLWTPPVLILLLYLPLGVHFKLSPRAKCVHAQTRYQNAILAFDRANKAYGKWRATHKLRYLEHSYCKIMDADWFLKEVPSFARLKQAIQAERSGTRG